MGALCNTGQPDDGLVYGLVQTMDCNVQMLVQAGYGALSRSGSPVMTALTILLTLYIGFTGFGLMIGRTPLKVGDLTVNVLKIGVVLALATNWATYQEVVLNALVHGPDQIGGMILQGIDSSGTGFASDPYSGLQAAYDSMQRGAVFFSQRDTAVSSPLQGGTAFAAFALNISALLLMMTTLGLILTAKLVLALLLSPGPVFVSFLLFDATRGLFHGWLRAVLTCALLPLLGILSLVVQLELLEPQIVRMGDAMARNAIDLSPPTAMFLLSLIFAMVSAALVLAVGVIGLSFRGSRARTQSGEVSRIESIERSAVSVPVAGAPAAAGLQYRDRATQVASAAATISRREMATAEPQFSIGGISASGATPPAVQFVPGGQPVLERRRSAQPRRSAGSVRRDA